MGLKKILIPQTGLKKEKKFLIKIRNKKMKRNFFPQTELRKTIFFIPHSALKNNKKF